MQRSHLLLHYTINIHRDLTNLELTRLCLRGDTTGQKLLYERFASAMARTCSRYLRERTEAEDALMEGFMKVFDNLKQFQYSDEKSLEAWTRTIMINECLMRLRKKKLFMTVETESHLESSLTMATDLAEEDIFNLLRQLPEGYRTVFNLFVVDGYSHKEISELLGISESASRSQLTHARNKLKERLKAHGWK